MPRPRGEGVSWLTVSCVYMCVAKLGFCVAVFIGFCVITVPNLCTLCGFECFKPVFETDLAFCNLADFGDRVKVGHSVAAPVAAYHGLVFPDKRGHLGVGEFFGLHIFGKCHVLRL